MVFIRHRGQCKEEELRVVTTRYKVVRGAL
jgi:hypothetical protein